ncbi:uncharacterized protein MYCGRDRAFT_94812 [Zymoseptoria tritici IPO323]|uniref:Uncharacterized protein n=1 Tax=Zymoseptoria tritici (strain CBS 115943 / IPO323) TaxID=336722 RepID=F9XF85_ZYMTI|nr:uncharacterized protein MYCGRDRAFT_94812 [Zymoseptoria tritici IPO323]EGP85886.1 hypothetical protein MYCGRDRAFT_94812 [Zymoseptoria tritici IPO323]
MLLVSARGTLYFAINRLDLRTFQPPNPELDFASLVAQQVVWAIRRPHIVQPNVSMTPTPYLTVINAKGLYDLGVLFAVQVEKATTLKESWHHNPLRFGTTKHQTAVEQQRFAEQEDDDDEDEQDEDE